jgi:hypothetical protein
MKFIRTRHLCRRPATIRARNTFRGASRSHAGFQASNPRLGMTPRIEIPSPISFAQTLSRLVSIQTSSYPGATRNRQPGPNPKYFTISGHRSLRWKACSGTKEPSSVGNSSPDQIYHPVVSPSGGWRRPFIGNCVGSKVLLPLGDDGGWRRRGILPTAPSKPLPAGFPRSSISRRALGARRRPGRLSRLLKRRAGTPSLSAYSAGPDSTLVSKLGPPNALWHCCGSRELLRSS